MRTIEIAVNDSAHRCLVLASIFFERPTHDLVALIPSFAVPTRRLIRIIRIRCKAIKPNTSNKTTHGSASAQLLQSSRMARQLGPLGPTGHVRYSARVYVRPIRHGRFFQITRSAEERDITFAYRSIIRRKFKKYILVVDMGVGWGQRCAPQHSALLLACYDQYTSLPSIVFFGGSGYVASCRPRPSSGDWSQHFYRVSLRIMVCGLVGCE